MGFLIKDSLADTQAMRFFKMLEGQIVSGELPPGHELSERSISEQLSIGRTPVHEALQKLAANRLVVIEPRRGTFVSPIEAAGTAELLYVACPLERLLMWRAGEHGSDEELQQLRALAAKLRSARPAAPSLYAEIEERIAAAARNPYLVSVLVPMRMLMRRLRILCGLVGHRPLGRAYAEVIDGVTERDKAETGIAFATYMKIFEEEVLVSLPRPAGS
jgi:DNA-binding GntR family transcriptional regulator